ncbi:hypothetical protein ABZ729_07870 [Streptomyces sp. NPDC006678]|uniref:hypothetical protein n=1 Tax=Streptomyces sp. NPDC006678 TaxID=3157185 RepID=UPI0033EC8596
MTGRGRRAALPPADHHSGPALAPDGLVVTVTNTAGYSREYDFSELPVPGPMQRSLARAFAARSQMWSGHKSATSYWKNVGYFARFLSQLENVPQDLDALTAAMLKRWRAQHISTVAGKSTLYMVRTLLRHDPRLAVGPVAEELAKRIPRVKPSKQSYGEAERERVVLAAQRQFRSAWLRIQENARLLDGWRAGSLDEDSREWRIGQVLDHVAHAGDVPRTVGPNGQARVTNRRLLGGRTPENTWGRLFLTRRELTALTVLMTDRFGWNLSVCQRMPTPTTAPSAGQSTSVTYQIQVEKRRSASGMWFSTENITDSGADSPGRLITQALEATAPARALAALIAPGTDLLMVARRHQYGRQDYQDLDRPRPVGPLVFGVTHEDGYHWALSHGLGGSPFQRARRTTVTREGRPLQHAQSTHESVYVLPDHRVQRTAQEVFEAGALEALTQARAVFAGRYAEGPTPDGQETAVAECVDEAASPWPAPDGSCGADLLLCLACPNAHVHPGHHPRLAHLHQQLESLRSVLDDRSWTHRWQDHLLRLDDLRTKIGPAAWNAAMTRVDDNDRLVVRLLTNGELAP